MFRIFHTRSLLLALAFAAALPVAAPAQSRPDALDAKASVPPIKYTSPLADYRRFVDEKPTPWKEANDTAARIGGWRAYARDATEPTAPAPGVSEPPATPAAAAPASSAPAGQRGQPAK